MEQQSQNGKRPGRRAYTNDVADQNFIRLGVCITPRDQALLDDEARKRRVTRAELVRRLIRNLAPVPA